MPFLNSLFAKTQKDLDYCWKYIEPTPIVSKNEDHVTPLGVSGEILEDHLSKSIMRGMNVDGKPRIGAVSVPVSLNDWDVELIWDHANRLPDQRIRRRHEGNHSSLKQVTDYQKKQTISFNKAFWKLMKIYQRRFALSCLEIWPTTDWIAAAECGQKLTIC